MTFFITPFHYTDCFSVRQIGYGGNLAQIDRQVRGQVEQTMERLVQRTRLPDKQTDPLGWAGTMNSLRQQAEETAMELIYGS